MGKVHRTDSKSQMGPLRIDGLASILSSTPVVIPTLIVIRDLLSVRMSFVIGSAGLLPLELQRMHQSKRHCLQRYTTQSDQTRRLQRKKRRSVVVSKVG